jgi:hypothetical protein
VIQQQTLERARPAIRPVNKPQFIGQVTDLIVPQQSSPAPRPQAFLVEQVPHWTLPAHFHQEHQFQLFVAGSGALGKRPIEHLAVHYAAPHSAYGPLISGEQGIAYLTLRAVGDTGAWYIHLPEHREQLIPRIAKRQLHGAPSAPIDAAALAALTGPQQETLIDLAEEGTGAWLMRLPPGACALPPAGAERGAGRFYVVTQGSLRTPTEELAALATLWAAPSDGLELQSGAQGLELVIVQFPAEAAESFVEARALQAANPGADR